MDDVGHDPFDDAAEPYLALDGVVMGRMIRSRGLKVRRRFICFRQPDALAVKVPLERADELVGEGLERFDRGDGRPMREWVLCPDVDASRWPDLLAEAYAYRLSTTD